MRVGLTLVFCLMAAPAMACDYCQRKVTLNPDLATCYLGLVDREIAQMEETGLPAQLINLAICEGASSESRGGGSLPAIATPTAPEPTLSFVLDAPALRCLAQELKSEDWNPEQIKTFEIRRVCPEG